MQNKSISILKKIEFQKIKNNEILINFLKSQENDLQKIVVNKYRKIAFLLKFIESQEGCLFSRMTGSGSGMFWSIFKLQESKISPIIN